MWRVVVFKRKKDGCAIQSSPIIHVKVVKQKKKTRELIYSSAAPPLHPFLSLKFPAPSGIIQKMLKRQDSSLSASRRQSAAGTTPPPPETHHAKAIGCMSGIFKLFSKYQNPNKRLTSGLLFNALSYNYSAIFE